MCYCPSVTRRPSDSRAATAAFEKWHKLGVEKGIRRIDSLVEIQTRLNRAFDNPYRNCRLARDLDFMLTALTYENKPVWNTLEFYCEKATAELFLDTVNAHPEIFLDDCDVCYAGKYYVMLCTLGDAWTFIRFASLVALKFDLPF